MSRFTSGAVFALLLCVVRLSALPPALLEDLGRGLVAVRPTSTSVFVSWRLLGNDSTDTAFNLYRATGGGEAVKINGSPLVGATNFTDALADLTQANTYFVRPIVNGGEQAPSGSFTIPANGPIQQYLSVPLQIPAGGTTPDGVPYVYSANDCSVADLDADGEYEVIVKWDPSNSKDNSQSGHTGNVLIDAYKMDGALLWRIDLGKNIRAGAHYTQFMVYDLDGDGIAELACRTAPGSKDGTGAFIATTESRFFAGTLPTFDPAVDYRNTAGYVLRGYEFLTIYNGRTGAELASTFYAPPRNNDINSSDVGAWGDTYGNRVDRFLACVAYLDGQRPSIVMCRGYYTRAVLAAWDWRDGQLTRRWVFDSEDGTPGNSDYRGEGAHSLTVGDVDGDGKDEIIYGAAAIDDDGTGLYATRLGHGDALHMSDLSPDRPGQEVWMAHEAPRSYGPNGLEFRDAATGALIFGVSGENGDVGRAVTMDIDPRYKGAEMWGARGGLYATDGTLISPTHPPQMNFAAWWDGDLLREILDGATVSKWDWNNASTSPLLAPPGASSINGTKATPNLSGDILGDWREEVIFRSTDNRELRIYTTAIPTEVRQYTLMHDRQYRLAIAWQNVAYNQPPHPSFYLGVGMAPAPVPNIVTTLSQLLGPPAPVFTSISTDTGLSDSDGITQDATVVINGTATPGTTVSLTRIGTGAIGSIQASSDGDWSFDYTATTLPEGPTLFTAAATDAEGDTGPNSQPFTIRVDATAPAAPAITIVSGGSTLVISGTAEPGTTVSVVLDNGASLGSAVADSFGRWTLSFAGPALSDGIHAFTATSVDAAGNASPVSFAFPVDATLATPTFAAISEDTGTSANDGVTNDRTLIFRGAADPNVNVTISRDGQGPIGSTTADATGAWVFDAISTVLPDGIHLFTASADNGGSPSLSSPPFAVTLDTEAPVVSFILRHSPVTATTSANRLVFRAIFSAPVFGVDLSDFNLSTDGTAVGILAAVTPVNSTTFDVSVEEITGEGAVRVDLKSSGTEITDLAGNLETLGFAAGQSYNRALTGNGVWQTLESGESWSENGNWLGGVVASGVGTVADFSTLDIEGDNAVRLDAPRTIGSIIFGDTGLGSTASWSIDDYGFEANILTLATATGPAAVVVNPLGINAVARFDAVIAGTAGFTKSGTGTLVFSRHNSVSGPIAVIGGGIILNTGSSLNTAAGTLTLSTSGTSQLRVNGGALTAGGLATVGAAGNAATFILESGAASFNGGIRTNSDFGSIIRVNGGAFTASSVEIRRNGGAAADFNSGFLVSGGVSTVATLRAGSGNSTGAVSVSGGSLTATGPVFLGNQVTAGRGGALRVTGGTFAVTDTTDGLVLARNPGTNPNNVASATFSGGVSSLAKITMGYDATVTAGSGAVTVNGGALYLGSGGIVKNGADTFATTVTLASGILGADTDWSTSVALTLPATSSIVIKAAGSDDMGHGITLSGPLIGAGGLVKAGSGVLTLSAANTYAGTTTISAGELRLTGSLAAASGTVVNSGALLSGTGTAAGAVTLNSGGSISPAGADSGTLALGALVWNGGGQLLIDLGTSSDQLALTGALTKGSAGAYPIVFTSPTPPPAGTTYTLATFGSTDFAAGDFSSVGSGVAGLFTVTAGSLQFTVFPAEEVAFQAWVSEYTFPAGLSGQADDADGDGLSNLLEFVLAQHPLEPAGSDIGLRAITVTVQGVDYPGLSFVRRHQIGGVQIQVRASTSPGFTNELEVVPVSITPRLDGHDDVVVRSSVPLSVEPRQFLRLDASLP